MKLWYRFLCWLGIHHHDYQVEHLLGRRCLVGTCQHCGFNEVFPL